MHNGMDMTLAMAPVSSVELVLLNYSRGDFVASGHCLKYARKLSLFSENFGTIASDHTVSTFAPPLLTFADLSLLLCHFCYDFQQRDHSTSLDSTSYLFLLPRFLYLLSELCPSCIMLQGVNIYLN